MSDGEFYFVSCPAHAKFCQGMLDMELSLEHGEKVASRFYKKQSSNSRELNRVCQRCK